MENNKKYIRMENEELEQFASRVANRVYSQTSMSRIRQAREIKNLKIAVSALALSVLTMALAVLKTRG